MKYIKTYESLGDYKKYFVIEVKPEVALFLNNQIINSPYTKHIIYKILDQEDKMNIKVVCVEVWENGEFELKKSDYTEIYIGPNQMKTAIYETDSLEDARNYISIITDANKYNL